MAKLLVSVLAVQEGPLSRTELLLVGRESPMADGVSTWTTQAVSELLRSSKRAGLVERCGTFDMAPHLREPIIRDLLRGGQYWVVLAQATKVRPLDIRCNARGAITYWRRDCGQRELRSLVYAGDLARYREIEQITQGLSAAEMVMDPLDVGIIARCHGTLLLRVLRDLCTSRGLRPRAIPGLLELLRESSQRKDVSATAEQAEACALLAQEHLLAGDLVEAQELLRHFSEIPRLRDIEGLIELAAGNIRAADRAYHSWLAWLRQHSASRKQVIPETLAGTFLPLVYLLRGTKGPRKEAIRLLELNQKAAARHGRGLRSGWQALAPLLDHSLRRRVVPVDCWHPASVLIEAIACHWADAKTPKADLLTAASLQAERAEMVWLVDELSAVSALIAGQPLPARASEFVALVSQRDPVFSRLTRILDQIDAQLPVATTANEPPLGTERVAWFVHRSPLQLSARIQKYKCTGWTRGRFIGSARVAAGLQDVVAATDQDRRLGRHLFIHRALGSGANDTWYEWSEAVWHDLVGHPFLFDMVSGEGLTVTLRSPLFMKKSVTGGVWVGVWPHSVSAIHVRESYPNHLEVTLFDKQQRALALIMDGGLVVPDIAADQLTALLERVASIMPITGDEHRDPKP